MLSLMPLIMLLLLQSCGAIASTLISDASSWFDENSSTATLAQFNEQSTSLQQQLKVTTFIELMSQCLSLSIMSVCLSVIITRL
jgi:hypothetical protein